MLESSKIIAVATLGVAALASSNVAMAQAQVVKIDGSSTVYPVT